MTNQHVNSGSPRVDIEYRRKQNAGEMKHQVVSFALMIFFTLIAFGAVAAKGFTAWFIVPFILLLAIVQVVFQLFYFMHMNHKGHEAPIMFMFTGIFFAFAFILAFLTIIWW